MPKKTVNKSSMIRHISKLEPVFVLWFFIFGKLMSNIEKRQDAPELLTANLGLRLGLKYFLFAIFLFHAHQAGH